jgi:CheY-like chemotaxis protein
MAVMIPPPRSARESFPNPQPLQQPPKPQPRVLIVDDDPDQVAVLVHRLKALGFQIAAENTGNAALERARTGQFDLVLLDVGLPDIDGYNVCQQLCDDPSTWTVPIVMLSGTDDPDAVRRSRAAGSRFYLRKPYDPNVLLMVVQRAIGEGLEP